MSSYTYNDEGLIQSEILIFNDKIINCEYIYEYNDNKQLIKKTRKDNNSSKIITYEYDAKGNLTKQSGEYGENKTFTFDDKKNVSSLHLFPKEFNHIRPIHNGLNNILSINGKNEKSIITYTYNEAGYPTKEFRNDYNTSDNTLKRTSTTEYFYQ